MNALHLFPNPPCWAPRTLLLRPQARGWGGVGEGEAAGKLGGAGWRAGRAQKEGGCAPRAAEAGAKAFALGGRKTARERPAGPRRGRGPGGAVEVPAPLESGFLLSSGSCPPLLPSFPPVNKYLPGQRTPRAASRWINFLEHQNRPSVSPLRSGYGARSLLFKKGNVALPKI